MKFGESSRSGVLTARKLKLPKAFRGANQTTCGIFDADNRVLSRIARAFCGLNEVRAQRGKHAPAETAARPTVRGSPLSSEPADYWPGEKAASREAPSGDSSDPKAEPSGEHPPELSSFARRVSNCPAAERKARRSRGVALPLRSLEIAAGRDPQIPGPAYSPAVLGMSPSGLNRAQLYVENADWLDGIFS